MTDLKALQYPRHVHKDGAFKVVNDADECDAALDRGWVLRPGDLTRDEVKAIAASPEPEPIPEPTTETTEHVDGEAESSLPVADVTEPDAPVRKPGRPRKAK